MSLPQALVAHPAPVRVLLCPFLLYQALGGLELDSITGKEELSPGSNSEIKREIFGVLRQAQPRNTDGQKARKE